MTNTPPATLLVNGEQQQKWLAMAPRPLVFTNGCFDILHLGHITYLQRAAEFGKTLLVALNSDASVKRLGKGGDRPLNILPDRMAIMAALSCVDAVCYFDTNTPLELIIKCKPEILIKGGDWPTNQIIGCKEVESWGGVCHSIAFEFERSTSALIDKIRHA